MRKLTLTLLLLVGTVSTSSVTTADDSLHIGLPPEQIFTDDVPDVLPRSPITSPDEVTTANADPVIDQNILPTGFHHATESCDWVPPFDDVCAPTAGCDAVTCEDDGCWLLSDEKLLQALKGQPLHGGWTYSIGGALRFRYLDESNRLRPPLQAGRSSYQQWRFTPYLEAKYGDRFTAFVEAIDASTFNNELPILPIDENRSDLLQFYVDMKVLDLDYGVTRYRYGRQLLLYGAQRLISPLGWSNTFRNFQGHKAYFQNDDWSIDAFAVNPVDGAARNVVYRTQSFDAPDESRWLSGVYTTYRGFSTGTLDLYWIWLDETDDDPGLLDGNRHTIGARWFGAKPLNNDALLWKWDMEGAYQFGTEDYVTGPDQDIQAGFATISSGVTFTEVPWTPTLTGVFWWGSGDDDPTDGTSNTVSTLYPLGHAYWGLIDNFNGSNLIDYSPQVTVKPHDKLTLLAAWHWFDKAARQDAIYNIAGVPFGGVSTTPRTIGNELDLVATYAVNENMEVQLGYFWFWYGDAVQDNPNTLVADRDDAEQIYVYVDWKF